MDVFIKVKISNCYLFIINQIPHLTDMLALLKHATPLASFIKFKISNCYLLIINQIPL